MTNTRRNAHKIFHFPNNPKAIENKIRQSYRAMDWAIIGLTILATINYIFFLKHGIRLHF